LGYVFLALENGRSVFPVERRASADLQIYRVPDPPFFYFHCAIQTGCPASAVNDLTSFHDAIINPGASGSGEPWPSSQPPGLDGTNYCQIFAPTAGAGGRVYQDTGIKYQAGATYQLTAVFAC
jgi:hypothetical protein